MTRKEAIKWLARIEQRYIINGDEGFDKARKEALHMAIETLEYLDNIEAYMHDFDVTAEEAIKALERKKGEWKVCDAKPPTWWYECSVCGNAGNIEYNYCPNCGADMRERREDDKGRSD